MPPMHILNAPTKLMKDLGYGAGYEYDHDAEEALLRPELLSRRHGARSSSTSPRERGFEREIGKRLAYWAKLRGGARRVSVQPRTVGEDEADIRLDRWFRRHFPGLTQGAIQKLCRTGQVRVDGKRAEAATRLAAGPGGARAAAVRRARPGGAEPLRLDAAARERPGRPGALPRRASDRAEQAARPAGAGRTGRSRAISTACSTGCASAAERPRLVHRLDRDTSGVLVLARTPGVAAKLAAAFRARRCEKTYWAIVAGRPVPVEGRIDLRSAAHRRRARRAHRAGRARRHGCGPRDHRLPHARPRRAEAGLAWNSSRSPGAPTSSASIAWRLGAPILGDVKYAEPDQNDAGSALRGGPLRSAASARPGAAPAASCRWNCDGRG